MENTPLTDSVMRMKLRGDTSAITAPGQFVNILIDKFKVYFVSCEKLVEKIRNRGKFVIRLTAKRCILHPKPKTYCGKQHA